MRGFQGGCHDYFYTTAVQDRYVCMRYFLVYILPPKASKREHRLRDGGLCKYVLETNGFGGMGGDQITAFDVTTTIFVNGWGLVCREVVGLVYRPIQYVD